MQGLADAGLKPRDILRDLKGCAKLNKEIVSEWDIETGGPQRGSLFSPLFQTFPPSLEQELRAAKCRIWLSPPGGEQIFISCLGYVDDLALLEDSPKMLRTALRIAEKWAQRLHIRWNIVESKSAVMLWGPGRRSQADAQAKFKLNGQKIPQVSSYKYLGVSLSNGGGLSAQIAAIKTKTLKRTHELISWCSQRV